MHLSPNFASLLTAVSLIHGGGAAVLPQVAFKAPSVEKREPHYIRVPVHAHHHVHGVSIFVGHHHEHHHPKTVIVSRNPEHEVTLVDIDSSATIDLLPVQAAAVDVAAKVNVARRPETLGRSRKQRTLNARHDYEEPEVFVEDVEPDVVIEDHHDHDHHYDHHYDHDHHYDEHIDIDRRGPVGALLDALLRVIDIISPGLGKTVGGVIKPVLGSLLLAAEPNAANQFAMQASTTAKSNVYLVEDRAAPGLSDGSRVVLLQTPVFDEVSQSMRTFCATFSTAADAPSPLLAAECSKENEASQRFSYEPDTGKLTPLRWVDPSSTTPSSRRADGMPCYDTVESPSVPSNVTAQTIALRFTPNGKAHVPHIKGGSMPIAFGAGDVAPTATATDGASTETPTSTVEVPADVTAAPIDIVQGIDGLVSEEPEATTATTTTDDALAPEETPVEEPAAFTPMGLTSSASKASNPVGRPFVLGFRPSGSPVTFRPSSS